MCMFISRLGRDGPIESGHSSLVSIEDWVGGDGHTFGKIKYVPHSEGKSYIQSKSRSAHKVFVTPLTFVSGGIYGLGIY